MSKNGQARSSWGVAVEEKPRPMLAVALQALRRIGAEPLALAGCNGDSCRWVREVAECLARGDCRVAVLFCDDAGLCCCVANKVPGVRAVAVNTVDQAERAVRSLGANLLIVEQRERTFYEFKQILALCCDRPEVCCPPGVAGVLEELDGHAHR